jgi:DNA-binding NarL/FixJ family response regulator
MTQLSTQQDRICRLLAQGFENKLIGARLGVSENTIRTHMKILRKKFQVHNRWQITYCYVQEHPEVWLFKGFTPTGEVSRP